MADPLGLKIVRVIDGGAGYTKVETADGQELTLTGDRNWRNNNPGNIRFGPYAKSHGAIGTDGAFAVFPSYESGLAAQTHLQFQSSGYKNKTIAQAARKYAPDADHNNSAAYASRLAAAAGVPTSAKLSELTQNQRVAYIAAQHKIEGFKPGRITDSSGNVIPNNALSAIDALAPDPQSANQTEAAYFKPLPAPAPLVPTLHAGQAAPSGFNLAPPNLPLNTRLPDNRGVSYGPETGHWAPPIGGLGIQPVPPNGVSAGGGVGNGVRLNGQVSLGGARTVVPPPVAAAPKVTFSNGLNSNTTDFERGNQVALMAGLKAAPVFGGIATGAEAASRLLNGAGQAQAATPNIVTLAPVAAPKSIAALGSVLADGAAKAGTGASGSAALAGIRFADVNANLSAAPVPVIPMPVRPMPLPTFRSPIIPQARSPVAIAPQNGVPTVPQQHRGGLLGALFGGLSLPSIPQISAPSFGAPSSPQGIDPLQLAVLAAQQQGQTYDRSRDPSFNPNGGANGGSYSH